MKIYLYVLAALSVVIAGCSSDKSFSVEVDIPSIGTQEITAVYTTDTGDRTVIHVPALDGKFDFTGRGVQHSTVELFKSNKMLLAAFEVSAGERLKLTADGDSLIISGTEIARVVTTEYADTIVTEWPEFVSPELVIARDSVHTYEREGVWFFTSDGQERTASLLDSVRAYAKGEKPVRDVFLSADISQWRMLVHNDSATWTQAMLPDGPLVLKGILLYTPCLVEVDSAGVVSRVQRLE